MRVERLGPADGNARRPRAERLFGISQNFRLIAQQHARGVSIDITDRLKPARGHGQRLTNAAGRARSVGPRLQHVERIITGHIPKISA